MTKCGDPASMPRVKPPHERNPLCPVLRLSIKRLVSVVKPAHLSVQKSFACRKKSTMATVMANQWFIIRSAPLKQRLKPLWISVRLPVFIGSNSSLAFALLHEPGQREIDEILLILKTIAISKDDAPALAAIFEIGAMFKKLTGIDRIADFISKKDLVG